MVVMVLVLWAVELIGVKWKQSRFKNTKCINQKIKYVNQSWVERSDWGALSGNNPSLKSNIARLLWPASLRLLHEQNEGKYDSCQTQLLEGCLQYIFIAYWCFGTYKHFPGTINSDIVKKWTLLKYKTSPATLLKPFQLPPPFLSLSLSLFFLLLLFLLLDSLLHPDLDDHLLPGLVHVHDDEEEVPDDGDGREILDHEY